MKAATSTLNLFRRGSFEHAAAFTCVALSLIGCGASGSPAESPADSAGSSGSSGSSGAPTSMAGGAGSASQQGGAGSQAGTSSGGSGGSPQAGTNSGGSLPTYGGASHDPPEPCPTDASKVGVWENVEPPEFHSPSNMQTIAVAVNPKQGSVYAAASNKTNGGDGSTGIWKSMDCGATWKLQSTGTNADKLKTGQLWAMLSDPKNPDNLYVANGYGAGPTLYKSPNGGIDWIQLKPDTNDVLLSKNNFVQCVALEEGNPEHVAVSFHDNCGGGFAELCLARSLDGGATWTMFNGPSGIGGWQEAATMSILGPTHYYYLSGAAGGWYTPDMGKTWTKVIDGGFFGRYAGSLTIAPDGTAYTGGAAQNIFFSKAADGQPLGSKWERIANSPQVTTIIHDGESLFAAEINGPPFFTAKLSDPTKWTKMDSPNVGSGSNQMAYDPIHHVVYSANFQSGLLRLVTKLPTP